MVLGVRLSFSLSLFLNFFISDQLGFLTLMMARTNFVPPPPTPPKKLCLIANAVYIATAIIFLGMCPKNSKILSSFLKLNFFSLLIKPETAPISAFDQVKKTQPHSPYYKYTFFFLSLMMMFFFYLLFYP